MSRPSSQLDFSACFILKYFTSQRIWILLRVFPSLFHHASWPKTEFQHLRVLLSLGSRFQQDCAVGTSLSLAEQHWGHHFVSAGSLTSNNTPVHWDMVQGVPVQAGSTFRMELGNLKEEECSSTVIYRGLKVPD